MHASSEFRARYLLELARLGLVEYDCPYGAMSVESEAAGEAFLARVRALKIGATWRDVFPDIPAHWDLEDPDSWTEPYRPWFSFDYPTLPTGPVCMAHFPLGVRDEVLEELLAEAREAGFLIYGAGWISIENPEWPDRPIRMVLHHTTTENQLHAFAEWLTTHPLARFDGVCRGVDEKWAPDPSP